MNKMYMSRVELDINRRETQRALNRLQYFHQAIENSFPGPRKRRLWRIDLYQEKDYLILVSEDKPNLAKLVNKFGPQSNKTGWESADYLPFLDNLKKEQQWHFRLSANPARAVLDKNSPRGTRGKVRAHVTPEQQIKWLLDKDESIGVEFNTQSLQIFDSNWVRFKKRSGSRVIFRKVTYEGLLIIKDTTLLRKKLTQGIGRQKAYGCGLLTLAPPKIG